MLNILGFKPQSLRLLNNVFYVSLEYLLVNQNEIHFYFI